MSLLGRSTPPPTPEELSLPDLPSSSISSQTGTQPGERERRNPSITPRKFNRFFTPRSFGSSGAASSRNALGEINDPANSRDARQSSSSRPPRPMFGQENTPRVFTQDLKRRKLYHTPESSPERVGGKRQDLGLRHERSDDGYDNIPSSPCERIPRDLRSIQEEIRREPVERIMQTEERGLSAHLLQLSINPGTSSRRQYLSYPVSGEFP